MACKTKVTRIGGASLGLVLALTAGGCGRLGLGDPLAGSSQQQTTYEPLPAAPTGVVTSSALPPPPAVSAPTAVGTQPLDPAQPGQPPAATSAGIPIATNVPPKGPDPSVNDKGPGVGRGEFVGAWRISSGADNCQLFVSLTSWSGGYRASTKGCNSAEMQRISAWDLSGKQVALKSGDGGVIALLSSAGQEKFAGTTTSKQAIALSR